MHSDKIMSANQIVIVFISVTTSIRQPARSVMPVFNGARVFDKATRGVRLNVPRRI